MLTNLIDKYKDYEYLHSLKRYKESNGISL